MKLPFFALLFGSLLAVSPVHALTHAEIQRFIDDATKAGGGEVVIPPGVHIIEKTLHIKDAKKLRIVGLDAEACVLKLPPAACAVAVGITPQGALSIPVKNLRGFKPGMRLKIEADGDIEPFTQKPRPYHLAIIQEAREGTLELKEPLKFSVPDGTLLRHEDAPNLFEIRGASEDIRIEKLTLDGGRLEGDPVIRGHVQLCAILASGAYHYEKGPTGPPVKKLHISRCYIQNCHGRGVALYSVIGAEVEDCTIRDTTDEAIDFDHFTRKALATHNHIARAIVGIELNDVADCLVAGNEFLECGTGINLWRWCKFPDLNEGNIIAQNLFQQTQGNAIQIAKGTKANHILQNEIIGSGKNGIILAGEAQIVKANKISGSKIKDIVVNEGVHDMDVSH